ncbi:formate dehydrogenase subunit gamma [Ferrimonas marina]|uniref:Formate dehydrogenase gamma subunit n=1 Tax=Ferrimonas marina TaxID=299255 RepID=A0A1M5XRI5_9GAMM|nr:formate dehydrogenase subunit gamma [Ferrimonas marina]SHI02431.1 formate dehydrogenase gamma subunit [Ferrimonas marina]
MFNKALKPFVLLIAMLFSGLALANGGEIAPQAGNEAEVVWQAIQQGAEGRTTSLNEHHPQLINSYDLRMLDWRNDWLSYAMFFALFGMIAVFIAFIAINGISKLEKGFSGKMVYRWSKTDVFLHWLAAIPCLLLCVTGLVLLSGKFIIEPLLGTGAFAGMANVSKLVHDYMAIPFMLGWIIISIKWAKNQIPARYDLDWFMVVGGYINFGPFKGKHPHAGFANAGEKLFFWAFVLFGLVISVSGVILLFPNLVEPSRTVSMIAVLAHGAAAIVLCAFSIVHIFMATVMSEGGVDCMISGYCDENWAIQHHDLWYDEIKANGTLKYMEK